MNSSATHLCDINTVQNFVQFGIHVHDLALDVKYGPVVAFHLYQQEVIGDEINQIYSL